MLKSINMASKFKFNFNNIDFDCRSDKLKKHM